MVNHGVYNFIAKRLSNESGNLNAKLVINRLIIVIAKSVDSKKSRYCHTSLFCPPFPINEHFLLY